MLIGAVGRLVHEKGYVELFEAMARVRSVHPQARLVVAGWAEPDKPDGLTPAEMAEAETAGVRFLGNVHDVETFYAAMDVYVLASHREGYPRSAMEASAMGLPIVVTDIRGCRQVVDHKTTGLLVPVRSPDALAAAIIELIDDAEGRQAMGAAGRSKAKADFDQQRVIDTTLATYERLLGEARVPSRARRLRERSRAGHGTSGDLNEHVAVRHARRSPVDADATESRRGVVRPPPSPWSRATQRLVEQERSWCRRRTLTGRVGAIGGGARRPPPVHMGPDGGDPTLAPAADAQHDGVACCRCHWPRG